jgi:ribosome maturation factor RimP
VEPGSDLPTSSTSHAAPGRAASVSGEPDRAESADDARARGEAWRERAARLEAIVEPVIAALGYELVHLEWSGSGRRHKLQVFIDHPDGIDLDDCSRLSPVVSNALDAAEVAEPDGPVARMLVGTYDLELSSPGLDRPLSRRSHFERFVGRRARIRTFAPLSSGSTADVGSGTQKNFNGRIAGVQPDPAQPHDDHQGTVELVDEDGGATHRIPLAQIRRANLVYEENA